MDQYMTTLYTTKKLVIHEINERDCIMNKYLKKTGNVLTCTYGSTNEM